MRNRVIAILLLGFMAAEGFAKEKQYPMGKLTGRKFGGEFADYLGVSGTVPPAARIDFYRNMEKMWAAKKKRSRIPIRNGKKKIVGYRPHVVVNALAGAILREYREKDPQHMTIQDYCRHLQAHLDRVRAGIDWKKVQRIERLSDEELKLVRQVVDSLHGDDLVAYSLTELFPGFDGDLNAKFLDFLLHQAGRRYVESIPAKSDGKASLGPYQMTEYAWYDGPSGKRGGSWINSALKDPVPHGSTAMLRGDQHHTVAILLMIHNLCYIAKELDKQERNVLKRIVRSRHKDVVAMIATAHHDPDGKTGASGAARRWLDNKAQLPYWRSCWSKRLTTYARKTTANLTEME